MESGFLSGIRLEDPPWINFERNAARASEPNVVFIDASVFTNVLQTKLLTLSQEIRSPEFNRQALLAMYGASVDVQVFDLSEPVRAQLYDAYGVPIPCQSLLTVCDRAELGVLEGPHVMDGFCCLIARSNSYTLAQLLLLHLFSFLIDEVANYWKEVEKVRESFRFTLVLVALRRQLKCGFLVRSLHTPLRCSRQSIHPIPQQPKRVAKH